MRSGGFCSSGRNRGSRCRITTLLLLLLLAFSVDDCNELQHGVYSPDDQTQENEYLRR